MAFRQTPVGSIPKQNQLPITQFRGIQINITASQLEDNVTPDMINVVLDDRGALDKRTGFDKVTDNLGAGAVNGLFNFKKSDGDILLFAYTDKLYKFEMNGTKTLIYTGLQDQRVSGFSYRDNFYIQDGAKYLVYDGTTVTEVVGHIPTVTIGTPPTGGGTVFEPLNILSSGFTQQFSGDAAESTYTLLFKGLDTDTVLIDISGVTLIELVDFTVNRTAGTVDFTGGSAPHGAPIVGTNNVEITAFKASLTDPDTIKKCRFNALFGGANDSRVFVSGNTDLRNRDWRSGYNDPTYFPVDGFDDIGSPNERITGYVKQYSRLVIFKERSQYLRRYIEPTADSESQFPVSTLNGQIGSLAYQTIQLIDNSPTYVSEKGIYQTISTDVQDERNATHTSDAIDRNISSIGQTGILQDGNLENFFSIDYEEKYFAFNPSNGKAWILDYRYGVEWFPWTNIYANCALEVNGIMLVGDSRYGIIKKLNLASDSLPYRDYNPETDDYDSIESYWRSKIFYFQSATNLKLVDKVFYTVKAATNSSVLLRIRSDRQSQWFEVSTTNQSLFSYSLLAYSTLTYGGNIFPQAYRNKIRQKKVGYFQFELSNDVINESVGIVNATINFLYQREIKR